MNRALPWIVGAALIALPFVYSAPYHQYYSIIHPFLCFAEK